MIVIQSLWLPSAMAQRAHNYPMVKFNRINLIDSDTFRIRIKVLDQYHCPPCSAGAQCKPCIGDHIIVSENRKSEKQTLRVFTNNPDQFEKGKIYILTVRSRVSVRARREDFLELVAD